METAADSSSHNNPRHSFAGAFLVDIVQCVGKHLYRFLVHNDLPSLIAADLPRKGEVLGMTEVIRAVASSA